MSYILRLSTPADSIALYRDGERQRLSAGFAVERDTADLKLHLYLPKGSTPYLVKVGLSAVSPEGAERNMQAELPAWDFCTYREPPYLG